MVSSPIISVAVESDPISVAAVGVDKNPWARPDPNEPKSFTPPRPAGMPESPRIVPARARGTHPAAAAVVAPSPAQNVAKQVVVGGAPAVAAEAELPYPERHVLYAENVAALLRSITRRDRLYDDVRPDQRVRLRRALDDAVTLLEQILRRDRK